MPAMHPASPCLYLNLPSIRPPQPRITPEILLFAVGESGDLLAGNQITAIRQRHIHQCRRPMAQCRRAPRCSGRRRSPQNCWGNPTSHRDRQRIAPHHIGSRLLEPRRAYSLAGVIYPHHAEIALAQGHRDDGQPAAVRHQRWMQGHSEAHSSEHLPRMCGLINIKASRSHTSQIGVTDQHQQHVFGIIVFAHTICSFI